ncbi:allatostatin [Episyrphus balteatus]|uniref:allatostatin n=1 Tax=Episyrphus balteatus TaxID=286459 RepID=UPI0024862F1B|nr:allatostatin [Episyrphus balteatus]XP_055858474.1 allatostatin [Episyrphus balteatus]XP_055858475.1 allatostatin [Episyrphus balteatus]XP_055858476.1 allatostatin [Episyrphus balteatus]
MVYSGQKLFVITLAVVLSIAASVEARPQYYETNVNEIEHIQPGQTYNPYYAYQALNRYPDSQYEKLRLFLDAPQDLKDDAISGGAAENLLREPMTKRQAVRYRQCYFNPISCFRK